jgi:hypothetical protein
MQRGAYLDKVTRDAEGLVPETEVARDRDAVFADHRDDRAAVVVHDRHLCSESRPGAASSERRRWWWWWIRRSARRARVTRPRHRRARGGVR